jgi:transaldolase
MKIFLDTAHVPDICERYGTGLIDGITTNPTLIAKSHRKPDDVYQELISMGIHDISMEVVGNAPQMVAEGLRLADLFGDNATIKVPCTPDGLMACRELARNHHIRVNVTLIFNSAQAVMASKAGATYVSPFVGRLDDNSISGTGAIKYIADLYAKHGVETKIIAASIRDVHSVTESFYNGAHICTIPPNVFDHMYGHVLTDVGMDKFTKDWELVEQIRKKIH